MGKGDRVRFSAEGLRALFKDPNKPTMKVGRMKTDGLAPVNWRGTVRGHSRAYRGCYWIVWDHLKEPHSIADKFLQIASATGSEATNG